MFEDFKTKPTENKSSGVNHLPIGVFDSGLGGLSVLMNLYKILPNEKFIYLGDTARVPYGNKSKETIIEYSKQCANFLLSQGVKLVVVACNTASSLAYEAIKKVCKDVPVIEMIDPASKAATSLTLNGRIGIIGTKGTIKSESYLKSIQKLDSFDNFQIFTKACPLFVPLVEEGMVSHQITSIIAQEYLAEFQENRVDTLILACTHYPFLEKQITSILPNIKLIDTGCFAALETQQILREFKLENNNSLNVDNNSKIISNFDLYSTDTSIDFKNVAELYLKIELPEIQKVDISYF